MKDSDIDKKKPKQEPTTKRTNKEKRLTQRRQIEDLMEKKRMREYAEDFDYDFDE